MSLDRDMTVARGIAQGAHQSPVMTEMARRGLINFLRQQILDAEWKIARAKSEIEAYEVAIKTIEEKYLSAPSEARP